MTEQQNTKFFSIKKTDDGQYKLENLKRIELDNHNCSICSYNIDVDGGRGGYCDIYNKLRGIEQQNHFVFNATVLKCDAYKKIEDLNIIKTYEDMVDFICDTENIFDSIEEYESYYGFSRKFDEETGEVLESTRDYVNNGGKFNKIPNKYPVVIYFSCREKLKWIYIGDYNNLRVDT